MIRRYSLSITLEEDLHSGTGTGGATEDSVQMRDRYGYPVIRDTHIKGLLREAGRFLCEIGKYSEDKFLRLFGDAKKDGALTLQSLRYQDKKSDWAVHWSSTSRELHSRAPKEDTLRTEEYVSAGSCFCGEFMLEDDTLMPFLEACLKRMTHIGSNRSRDGGRIRITECKAIQPCGQTLPQPASGQTVLRLLLKNIDPLYLPVTGNPGNIISSECYIRGQQLLGALTAHALREQDNATAGMFLQRMVCAGNAYPLPMMTDTVANTWQVLPFPLNIQAQKPPGQQNLDWPWWAEPKAKQKFLGNQGEEDQFNRTGTDKLKRPGDREFLFWDEAEQNWRRYQPTMNIHMRNRVRVAKKGEDGKEVEEVEDALFSSEEIAEDTCFIADIRFNDPDDIKQFCDNFEKLFDTWLLLGRGGCPVQVEDAVWLDCSMAVGSGS